LSATVAAIVGAVQARTLPHPEKTLAWWRQHRTLAAPLTAESIIGVGAGQLAAIAIAAVAGLATLGALRAGQLLLGPLLVVYQGLQLIAIPEGSRILRRSRAALRRACIAYAAGLGTVVLAWGMFIYLIPISLGLQLLGPNWLPAHEVVLPLSTAFAAGLASSALSIGIRVLAKGRRALVAGVTTSLLSAGGSVVGAALWGAVGSAVVNTLGTTTGLGVTWRQLHLALGEDGAPAVAGLLENQG
jgi:O-antigen/teichoic acid export membrane protein